MTTPSPDRNADRMDLEPLAGLFADDCLVEYGPAAGFTSHGRARLGCLGGDAAFAQTIHPQERLPAPPDWTYR